MNQKILRILILSIAETMGTAILIFLACMGCVDLGIEGIKPTHLSITLGVGLTLMMVVNIYGCVSGAHVNPAVTLAAYVCKMIDAQTAMVYGVSQCVGAFIGYGLLRILTPTSSLNVDRNFCLSLPTVDPVPAFIIEFVITMVLILICCAIWDSRNEKNQGNLNEF